MSLRCTVAFVIARSVNDEAISVPGEDKGIATPSARNDNRERTAMTGRIVRIYTVEYRHTYFGGDY